MGSSGDGSFVSTSTSSTLTVGTSVITVYTCIVTEPSVAVPAKVNFSGSTSDTASLYDAEGSNSLLVAGSKATLTRATNTVSVGSFGTVNAYDTLGSDDTVSEQSINIALQTIGNWTSG